MVNEPIKLQNNINLYSGDIITVNNSNPLLVEIENDKNWTVKLRNVKDDEYLSKSFLPMVKSLGFSTNFENSLVFTVNQNDKGEISFQTNDNKYLKSKDKGFSLSSKERLLIITKQQNIGNIASFKEITEDIRPHKEKEKKISDEEVIACKSYNNKGDKPWENNFEFDETIQNEHSLTWSTDFTWGVSTNFKLIFSKIAGIDISGKLEEKSSTSNSIKKTETKTFKESLKVECSPWKKTRVKLLAKKVELLTPYTATVKRVIGGRIYEYIIDGEYFSNSYSESDYSREEIPARNILLVGCTGGGKSTLAKVLSGDNRFEEGDGSVSKTKYFKKSDEFKWKEDDYYVIDNIGFGDTKIEEREEMIRIGEAINSAKQGLSHVLFIFGGKFSDKEKEGFRRLAALKITNSLITLVRSKFDNFGNERECKKDEELLRKESVEISQLFDNCLGLLHINNGNERSRNKSREKVLDYLHNNCTNDPFKPKEWNNIDNLIEKYMKDKERLETEIKEVGQEEKTKQLDNLTTDTANQIKEKVKEGEEICEFVKVIEVANK